MAIEKLNDEELDMVTGGNQDEMMELLIFTHMWGTDTTENWLKANLNIDATLFRTNQANEYSITKDGVTHTLSHAEVIDMLKEFHKQHPNG